jgi:hypothetical protein
VLLTVPAAETLQVLADVRFDVNAMAAAIDSVDSSAVLA